MKRSAMLRVISRAMKTGDSKKVLEAIQKAGMLPPYSTQRDLGCECGCRGWCQIGNDWDNERKLTGEYGLPGRRY